MPASVFTVKPIFPPGKAVTAELCAMQTIGFISNRVPKNAWQIAYVDVAEERCRGNAACSRHTVVFHMDNGIIVSSGPIITNTQSILTLCAVLGVSSLSNGGTAHFKKLTSSVTDADRRKTTIRLNEYYIKDLRVLASKSKVTAKAVATKRKRIIAAKATPRKRIAKAPVKRLVKILMVKTKAKPHKSITKAPVKRKTKTKAKPRKSITKAPVKRKTKKAKLLFTK